MIIAISFPKTPVRVVPEKSRTFLGLLTRIALAK
jgi:hypothetical protein